MICESDSNFWKGGVILLCDTCKNLCPKKLMRSVAFMENLKFMLLVVRMLVLCICICVDCPCVLSSMWSFEDYKVWSLGLTSLMCNTCDVLLHT